MKGPCMIEQNITVRFSHLWALQSQERDFADVSILPRQGLSRLTNLIPELGRSSTAFLLQKRWKGVNYFPAPSYMPFSIGGMMI